MNAIRKQARNFAAIIGLILLSLLVGGYIVSQERLKLPSWVPIFGQSFYTLKAEFQTGQALTPGQGQTVDIAGVPVGEISDVELKDGRAIVTMKLRERYSTVYPDATMLLRPKTGLKDMIVELDPGSSLAGDKLKSGSEIPISNTLPDVNLDELLASLDGDTRSYLQLLIAGGAAGLKGNGQQLSAAFRRFDPTSRLILQITKKLSERRRNLAHVQHSFQVLVTGLSTKDRQLAGLVDSSSRVFRAFADQDANLRSTLQLLPPTLRETQVNLGKASRLANVLGPTLQSLRPTARALAPALRAQRPFLRDTTPIIRDEIRPFTKAAVPTVRLLRPAARNLTAITPNLTTSLKVANYLLNELAYNPPGKEEGYSFWISWANHDANSVFSTQDAHGVVRRGLVLASCSTLSILNTLKNPAGNPYLAIASTLLNSPPLSSICPSQTGAGSGSG